MQTTEAIFAGQAGLPPGQTQVEIVIPVRDEERDLGPGIRRLREYLTDHFPFAAMVTIADNGSCDGTWVRALDLENEFAAVRAVRIERAGRWLRFRGPDHRVGQGTLHRADCRRADRLRPHDAGADHQRVGQLSRTMRSAGDRWSTISPVATNVRVTRAEL